MLETSGRLLRLLSLFQGRRYWPGGELCGKLGVTARTLRRDVDRLRGLGYPVESSAGVGGGYQLGAGAALPPLLLEDDEAVAVAVGLRTGAGGSVEGIEEAAVRALAKLQQVLPPRLRRRVAALQSSIVPLAGGGPRVDAETLAGIAAACRDCEGLRFTYRGREGAAASRDVEPHRLVHTAGRWYLAAWDTGRRDWRTFRVDRIEPKITTGLRFKPRRAPEGGFAAYVSRSVAWAPYKYRARVVLHAPLSVAAERIPAAAGALEEIDANTCLLETGSHSLDTLAVYLALAGMDFEVREPAELIERLRELERRFRGATRGASPTR